MKFRIVIQISKEEKYKRYISVEQSIIGALLEVREMRAVRLPKQSLKEFFAELRAEEKKLARKQKFKAGSFCHVD